MIPFSILDLAPIREGSDAAGAFRDMREQARHAERLGFHRYWLAEHHNMVGIGSAATSVLIGHVAGATETIRVGSGGVMLPNHAPLVIAEQFGTLASLYPGRIDLGLGRAPGTDQHTTLALRRERMSSAEDFPRDVMELQYIFREAEPEQAGQAVPGAGVGVPLWLVGPSVSRPPRCSPLGCPFSFPPHARPLSAFQHENAGGFGWQFRGRCCAGNCRYLYYLFPDVVVVFNMVPPLAEGMACGIGN